MASLSLIVITKNEGSNLEDCLASVAGLADEIVVVDSGSSDNTLDIARQLGAVVLETDWPGFGPQKNRALDLASGEWVLSLDADERLTPELKAEIRAVLAAPGDCNCFALPRLSWYCGRFMRHSGWYPDHVDRLFRRGTARFSDARVHERLLPEGPVTALKTPMVHYSFRDFSAVLKKVDAYSSLSAREAYARGKRSSVLGALGHGLWAFIRTYVFKAGFLDGSHGLALAISNAEGSYYRYLKIWLLQQEENEVSRRD